MFRVIISNTCNVRVRVRVRVHGHLLNYTVEDEDEDEDDDEDDGGGSLLHSRARHEPTQKIENITPTIIPITLVISIIFWSISKRY